MVAPTNATGSILDNEIAPVISIDGDRRDRLRAARRHARLRTSPATRPPPGTIVVALTWSGTAIFGTDYTVTATGGSLSADGRQLTLARRLDAARR